MNRETEQKVIERLADLVQEEQDAGFMLALSMVEVWLNDRREKYVRYWGQNDQECRRCHYTGRVNQIDDMLAYFEVLRGQQERYNG